MMATARSIYEDGLIDLTIVWESLVGSDSGTLGIEDKICSAMSILLTDDSVKQEKLKEELKQHYEARSRVVHGSAKAPTGEALQKIVLKGFDATALALHKLADRPDLLDKNSKTRAKHLIQGSIFDEESAVTAS